MTRLAPSHHAVPRLIAVASLLSVVALLAWDVAPGSFPHQAHDVLGALPLTLIALGYLAYQAARRPSPLELGKAVLLAVAFLLWAANQLWPASLKATLLNDLAIALFVLDVFLGIVGWPGEGDDSIGVASPRPPATSAQFGPGD
jgi:hypothetical protein